MLLTHDWTIRTEVKDEQTCIHAVINDDVDITGLEFILLDDERKLIIKLKVTHRDIYFCTAVGNPMFAQLGGDTKYVSGSGADFYEDRVIPIVESKDLAKIQIG